MVDKFETGKKYYKTTPRAVLEVLWSDDDVAVAKWPNGQAVLLNQKYSCEWKEHIDYVVSTGQVSILGTDLVVDVSITTLNGKIISLGVL